MIALRAAGHTATVTAEATEGVVQVELTSDPATVMAGTGCALPLPPYLGRDADDADTERYQTVFAGPLGAAAAPTAGSALRRAACIEALRESAGSAGSTVTLHVGLGTFRPLRPEDLARGRLHSEWFRVPDDVARAIASDPLRGGARGRGGHHHRAIPRSIGA